MRTLCMKNKNIQRRKRYHIKKQKNIPIYESDDELVLSVLLKRIKKKKEQDEKESQLFSQSYDNLYSQSYHNFDNL